MPAAISELSKCILHKPIRVEVTPPATTVELIEQSVMLVEKSDKTRLLADVLAAPEIERALVFTRTKHGANRVVRKLERAKVIAEAIHGNKSQSARQRALQNFKDGKTRVLVATDIAARGIDIEGISHVINYDLPNVPESYVHRIGRTARAGAGGKAISFCDVDERGFLHDIERLIRQRVEIVHGHPYESVVPYDASKPAPRKTTSNNRRRGRGRRPQRAAR
jgi:ATP-dependent RNA helicase RhlE